MSYWGVTKVEREVFSVVATSALEERDVWLGRAAALARSAPKQLQGWQRPLLKAKRGADLGHHLALKCATLMKRIFYCGTSARELLLVE